MEFITEFGFCRFCQSEGQHRDIMKEYSVNGKCENYSDIFLECFNIFISTSVSKSSLICVRCVDNLRAARAFRDLVLRAEQGRTISRPRKGNQHPPSLPGSGGSSPCSARVQSIPYRGSQGAPSVASGARRPPLRPLRPCARVRFTPCTIVPRKKPVTVKLEPVIKTEPSDDVDMKHDVIVDVKQESEAELLIEAKPEQRELKPVVLYRCKSKPEPDPKQAQDKPTSVITRSTKMAVSRTMCKFRCVFCGKVFSVLSALSAHQKLAHKVGSQRKMVA